MKPVIVFWIIVSAVGFVCVLAAGMSLLNKGEVGLAAVSFAWAFIYAVSSLVLVYLLLTEDWRNYDE